MEFSDAPYDRIKSVADAGLPHMPFHQLRHEFASVALLLNIPQKYIMEKGGWKTNRILESVYQHTFSSEMDIATNKIDDYFSNLLPDS